MFKSKIRAINIPQFDHGRLTGLLASIWGNEHFGRPGVDFASFVAGIALHDRGYGYMDNSPIGETSESEWLTYTRIGFFERRFDDPVADLITRYHLRRLTRSNHAATGHALLAEMDTAIDTQLEENHFAAHTFDWIDRITNLLDMISFDFCFEVPLERELAVRPRWGGDELVTVHYEIQPNRVLVDPWPFTVPRYETFLIGYAREGYPSRLEPTVIPVEITPTR
jgi:hypothetical protein